MSENEKIISEAEIHENPMLAMTAEKGDSELKDYLVHFTGTKLDKEEVTVNMIAEVLAVEFPEFMFAFAEENFSRGTSNGWRSDMGMIYILFGRPDDISRSMNPQQSYNYETWYYYQINEEFRFVDDFGFGDYRLRSPFLY